MGKKQNKKKQTKKPQNNNNKKTNTSLEFMKWYQSLQSNKKNSIVMLLQKVTQKWIRPTLT